MFTLNPANMVDRTTNLTILKKQHIIHVRYLRIQYRYHSEKELITMIHVKSNIKEYL